MGAVARAFRKSTGTIAMVSVLSFMLAAVSAGAQQPCPKAKRGLLDSMVPITIESGRGSEEIAPSKNPPPRKPPLQWPEMTREQAFYYWVAVYGAPPDLVDRYARLFDADNYRRAMANEFERAQYRQATEARIMSQVRALTFNDKFTYLSWPNTRDGATFGEYSFADHAFPVVQPKTGFSYFNYYGFGVNPFDLGMALNTADFDWSLPLAEGAAKALLGSQPDRLLTLRIVYSVTREKNDVNSSRFYLTPFIYAIDVFADQTNPKQVGTLSTDASAPRDPQEWSARQTEAARLLIGTWRGDNYVYTYSTDGTCLIRWNNGTTRRYKWTLSRGIIEGEMIEMDGKPVLGAGGYVTRIVSITASTLVRLDSECKTWTETRVGAVAGPGQTTGGQANPESSGDVLARGEEVTIPVTYDNGVDGQPLLHEGQVAVSRSAVTFRGTSGEDFLASPDRIIDLAFLPVDPSKGGWSLIQSAPSIKLKVAVRNNQGDKERKRVLRIYNSAAKVLERVQWGFYANINIVDCTGCDDSLNVLYALIEKVRGMPNEKANVGDEAKSGPQLMLSEPTKDLDQYRAIVTATNATFTFPIDATKTYHWCSGGCPSYTWHVKVHNGDHVYEIGYYLLLSNAISQQGNIRSLLDAGQFSAWEYTGNTGKILPGIKVEGLPDLKAQTLTLQLTGANSMRTFFSDHPKIVIMESETDTGHLSQQISVMYH